MSEEGLIKTAEELLDTSYAEELSEQLERESMRYSRSLGEEAEARLR